MRNALQEGYPIYRDPREGLHMGWAAREDAFYSGLAIPNSQSSLFTDLSVQLQLWIQCQADDQRTPTLATSVIISLGPEDARSHASWPV